MRIRAGFEIAYDCPQPAPMMLQLSVHPKRRDDLETADWLQTRPMLDVAQYIDGFGNICSRILAPPGRLTLSADFIIRDSGLVDEYAPDAPQVAIQDLPAETLIFLLGSRYCETDRMSETAWALFGHVPPGWARVQAIVDYVHAHITFGYEHARPTKSAHDAMSSGGACAATTPIWRSPSADAWASRPATAPAIWATSACRSSGRWTSAPGLRPIWAAAGTPSIRETTSGGSDGS